MSVQVWTSKSHWKAAVSTVTPDGNNAWVAMEVGRLQFKGVQERIDVMEVRMSGKSDRAE